MPWVANQNGKNVRPHDVDKHPRHQFTCIECNDEMCLVEEHDRKDGVFVPRHFRHKRSDTRSCGLAGGGGGESSIHERRKSIALSKALVRFECADWGLEEQIGENQADAYVKFKDGHSRYGIGLAIEYQHKNKSKDRNAATQNYLAHNYTTVWLWGDQYTGNDVNLFGGEVHQVWPHPVPAQDHWSGPGFTKDFQQNWTNAYDQDLTIAGAPATLPPKWVDNTAQRLWREQFWQTVFPDFRAYKVDSYLQSKRASSTTEITLDLACVPDEQLCEWYEEGQRKYADAKDHLPEPTEWKNRMTYLEDIAQSDPVVEIVFPYAVVEEYEEKLRKVWGVYANNEYDLIRRLGENSAARRCTECSDPADYYVYLEGVSSRFVCAACSGLAEDTPETE